MLWLIRFSSDLTTKLRNTRRRFQGRLLHNLRDALAAEGIDHRLDLQWSRLYLKSDDPRVPGVLERVFGVHSFSLVHARPQAGLDALVAEGKALYGDAVRGKTYAVRARRSGGAPFGSMDVQRALGAALNPGARVDLSNPEVTVHVEVREGQVYFFTDSSPGPDGLPLGVEGRALALMSGGFDSAVAAWMMLKRGLKLDYVFFRLGGQAHERDVQGVVQVLARHWSYGTQPQLYVVPFEDVVRRIQDRVHMPFWQIALKRQMLRVACAVGAPFGARTLVTGEALGQVSSQTLANLETLNITENVLVLRPLIGFDKNEIIQRAYRIGTGAISAHVPEYCAIVPQRPATAAKSREVDHEEAQLALDPEALARGARCVDLRQQVLEAPAPEVVEALPEGDDCVLLDIRTEAEFRRKHDPRALHFDFAHALDLFARLDKRSAYYVYCNVGLKSANLVERMRAAGYRAVVYQPRAHPLPSGAC